MSHSKRIKKQSYNVKILQAKDFQPEVLLIEKEKRGLKIGIAIPTLNEEATIGQLLKLIKNDLMNRLPLIDKLVVIDSDSTDKTERIVAQHNIPFIKSSKIVGKLGLPPARGKGQNLWASLLMLDADIILWIDADAQTPTAEYITGLLGPILTNQRIRLVKAIFKRKTNEGNGNSKAPTPGGRVTELMVRPAFCTFFPELKELIQPFNGNVAVHRKALENLRFPTGYGADLSIPIDISMKYGIGSIAQVYCGKYLQNGHDLKSLGVMAHQALSTILKKAEQYGRIKINNVAPNFYQPELYSTKSFKVARQNCHQLIRPSIKEVINQYQNGLTLKA